MAAILLYFEGCKNPEFSKCLLEKYGYSQMDFIEFEKTITCLDV
jgi:hypothetical protein